MKFSEIILSFLFKNVIYTTYFVGNSAWFVGVYEVLTKDGRTQKRLRDDQGFLYQTVSFNPNNQEEYWRCQFARCKEIKCKAKAFTISNDIVRTSHEHCHDPPTHQLQLQHIHGNKNVY